MRSLICTICGKDFTTNHSRQITCSKECSRISGVRHAKSWQKRNPSALRANDLRKRYWPLLSNQEAFAEYEFLLKQQNNSCAVCYETEADRELSVDHCHKTGKVRGLLCSRCNTALGLLRDNIEIVKSLISYLTV